MNQECKQCISRFNCQFTSRGFFCNSANKREQGFKDACEIIKQRLTEMQGEYITLELINKLMEETKNERY